MPPATTIQPRLLQSVPAPRLREVDAVEVYETRRAMASEDAPAVMVVSESPLLRLAMGRELAPVVGLIHATGIASAMRRLEMGVVPAAVVVVLDSAERGAAHDFLARLVEMNFAGPRILVSSRFCPELAEAFSGSCLTHFALARPWRPGAMRSMVESALGLSGPLQAAAGR